MDIIKICGLSIIAVVLIIFLKQLKSSYYLPLSIIFCILLIKYAVERIAVEIGNFDSILENVFHEYTGKTILKVFGISFIAETVSDICRDAGESSIASKIELFCKAEILILCIPLIKEILEIIKNLMI